MGSYDSTFKRLAADSPADIAWLALGEEPAAVEQIQADLPTLAREVDFVGRVRDRRGRLAVLHVECARDPREEMVARVWEYRGFVRRRERLPVYTVVLELEGTGPPRRIEEVREVAWGRETEVLRYEALNLTEWHPDDLLAAPHPVAWAFVSLSRHAGPEVLSEAVRKIREAQLSACLRADLLAGLTLFGGVRATRELLYSLVRREEMKNSVIYQDIFQEGRTEGHAEGHAEGRTEGRREDILHILGRRFGAVPEEVRRKVGAAAGIEALDRLLDLALTAPSLPEFLAQV
jgi:predicted transposase YdaD